MESLITNEKQNLHLLIENPELLDRYDQNYFISPEGKVIFEVLRILENEELDFSIDNIVSEGNKKNSGVTRELLGIILKTDYNNNAPTYYLKRLRKDYAKFQIEKRITKNLLVEVTKKDNFDLNSVKENIDYIQEYVHMIEGRESLLLTLKDMGDRYSEVLDKRDKGILDYSTGDAHLDSILTMKFQPKYVSTLFAATGIGKSAFALNLINQQINLGIPCMYISLEMDTVATMDRLIALRRCIPTSEFYSKHGEGIPGYVMKLFEEERIRLNRIEKFFFVEEPGLSLNDVRNLIKDAKKKMKRDYLAVTIDLLTMIKEFKSTGYGTTASAYEAAMDRQHELARELNVHFINVVQAHRQLENVRLRDPEEIDRLKPHIQNIKNSSAIGDRSRQVIALFRRKFYLEKYFRDSPENEIEDDIIEVYIDKQTQGQANMGVKYKYIPEYFACVPFIEEN